MCRRARRIKWVFFEKAAFDGARTSGYKILVDLVRFELTTSSMPWKRAPNCATGPPGECSFDYITGLAEFRRSGVFRYHGRNGSRTSLGNCYANSRSPIVCGDMRWRWRHASRHMRENSARTKPSGPSRRCCTISIGRFIRSARSSDEGRADSGRARGGCGDPARDSVARRFTAAYRGCRRWRKHCLPAMSWRDF